MQLTAKNIDIGTALELIDLPDNTVMISISEEKDQWRLRVPPEKIYSVVFHDARQEFVYRDQYYTPITDRQGQKLMTFITDNRKKNFLVHCNAGVSRSSAVCLFIHKNFGHELKANFWLTSQPNPLVFGILQIQYELSQYINATNGGTRTGI